MSDINVTPLVDVMLVLLVIFIIAAPVMAGRLALELPTAQTPAAVASVPPESAITINLDISGQIFWNDQPLTDNDLIPRLQDAAQRDPATELHLHADNRVPYGRVVALIGMAQSAGLSRIGFVAEAPATGQVSRR